jgi:tetratricopeptide (TPR) repeat protein
MPESADPLAVYKSGDYFRALPLLHQEVAKNPKDAALHAALLSVLTYLGHVDEAADAADQDAQEFPTSAQVLAARGEFAFYMGDIAAAAALFHAALKLDDKNARAVYGLYHLQRAQSNYRSARILAMSAYELDPEDALIALTFSRYLVGQKRKEFMPEFSKSHPWFFAGMEDFAKTDVEVNKELNERKPFESDGPRAETTVPLFYLHDGPRIVGVGIHLTIGEGKKLSLILDTGASGILLSQAAIDKAGLNHLGSTQVGGIGDKGMRNAFLAVADGCAVGNLKFKTCVFGATEGKKRAVEAEDGLLGTDVFDDYLITIDFQRLTLHLVPLPERPPSPQAYDRQLLPDEQGFTPLFRFGHNLDVPTMVNNKTVGLFLIDTGSQDSFIDSTFARLSMKIHNNEYMRVRGVSGSVKDVFEADQAILQFSTYRQRVVGLTAFDLNNRNQHQEVRMDGILGLPVLAFFRLTLDYRNGLVKFERVN